MKKKIGISLYGLFIIFSITSLFSGTGEVIKNLDGWHDFSAAHSFLFIIICLLFAGGAAINAIALMKDNLSAKNILIGFLLFFCPIIFQITITALKGDVDSDFQYLMLRTFQGFDKTYILLLFSSIIAFPCIITKGGEK